MSDQSATTARRYDLALIAYRNAGDDPTAQALANRLSQSWFACDCEALAQQQPPPESVFALIAGLPCIVKAIIPEPEHPLKRLMLTDQAAKRLANGLQNSLGQLRQMQTMQSGQVKQKSRAVFVDKANRRRKAKD